LIGLPEIEFVIRLAFYYSELNAIHPFRRRKRESTEPAVCIHGYQRRL